MSSKDFAFQQQQNLGRRFGAAKMHLSILTCLWVLSVLLCCFFFVDSLFIVVAIEGSLSSVIVLLCGACHPFLFCNHLALIGREG